MVFLPKDLVDSQQSGFSSPDAGVPTVSPTAGGEDRVPGGASTPSAFGISTGVFAGVDELVDWAIARGRENGYVLVRRRSKTNATGVVIKVWLKCDRGGVYHGEPKVRRTGSKKTGCEFELIGRYERSCGG
ncbi:hypothetical protein E3N88_10915 [Mikania micrantha]|uniref:FAR1 domain-containing protein n=1 Tax=Mikania micrantha TaxID=192012 RepID=A0A5N6NFW0_9ASTR|nr:hypothetical protein E3N88_23970 [Mikania micrantha]KAD6119644.1 hypothetical protein E3N88_10915 [Mikania micrantha]